MASRVVWLLVASMLMLGAANPKAAESVGKSPAANAKDVGGESHHGAVQGHKVSLDDLAPAVREAIAKQAGEAKVTEVAESTSGTQKIYQAQWPVGQKTMKLKVSADGKVVGSRLVGTDFKDFPEAVRETIAKTVGKNKIIEVEQISDGSTTSYEVEWMEDGKHLAMKIAADGASLGKRVRATTSGGGIPRAGGDTRDTNR